MISQSKREDDTDKQQVLMIHVSNERYPWAPIYDPSGILWRVGSAESTKSKLARQFFITKAHTVTENLRYTIKREEDYEAIVLPNCTLRHAKYNSGDEYIHDPNWDGRMDPRQRTPLEPCEKAPTLCRHIRLNDRYPNGINLKQYKGLTRRILISLRPLGH